MTLSKHNLRGVPEHPDAMLLLDGVRRLTSHLVQPRFNIDDAKVAAGKIGLLTTLLLNGRTDFELMILRYDPANVAQTLADVQIAGEWERLNRLKAPNSEAFYYWYKAYEREVDG